VTRATVIYSVAYVQKTFSNHAVGGGLLLFVTVCRLCQYLAIRPLCIIINQT